MHLTVLKKVNFDFGQGGTFVLQINQLETVLPDKSTFSNIIDLNPGYVSLSHGYGPFTPTNPDIAGIVDKNVTDFSMHRTTPTLYISLANYFPDGQVYWDFSNSGTGDPALNVDFSALNTKIQKLKEAKFKSINIAPYFYSLSSGQIQLEISPKRSNGTANDESDTITCPNVNNCPSYDSAVKEYFSQWSVYLAQNGLEDDAIYYLADEPDNVAGANLDGNLASLKHLAGLIKEVSPKIKTAFTYFSTDQTVINKLLNNLGDVDIWIAHLRSATVIAPKTYLPANSKLWLYDTGTEYRTDVTPEQARVMPLLAYKFGAEGMLYWAATNYSYTNPWQPEGEYNYGVNQLVYPPEVNKGWTAAPHIGGGLVNAPNKSDEIVGSIRLEMIREGIEDIELVRMLEASDQSADVTTLLGRVSALAPIPIRPLEYTNNTSFSIQALEEAGNISTTTWRYIGPTQNCVSDGTLKKCLFADPGLTPPGTVTINIPNIKPGKYKMNIRMLNTSSYNTMTPKPVGSAFKMSINGGESKLYNYFFNKADTNISDDTWPKSWWSSSSNMNNPYNTNWNPEILGVVDVADGNVTLNLESVEGYRAVIFGFQLTEVIQDYGVAALMTSVKDAFAQKSKPEIISVNLIDGQMITTNPYIISVQAKDAAETLKISKVEFYIDNTLIGTTTLPTVSGVYDCLWDTSKYHSTVKIIVYGTDGTTQEITRNTTVNLSSTQDNNDIVVVLPKTGEEGLKNKLVDYLDKIKELFRL